MNNFVKKDTQPVIARPKDRSHVVSFTSLKEYKQAKEAEKAIKSLPVKRNKSAYIYFCEEMRPQIVADNPNAKGKDIMMVGSYFIFSCSDVLGKSSLKKAVRSMPLWQRWTKRGT
jgi:hypothetical protein